MKIEQSQMYLASQNYKKQTIYEKEQLKQWHRPEDNPNNQLRNDTLRVSKEYEKMQEEENALDPKIMAMVRAIEAMTGKKIDLTFAKKLQDSKHDNEAVQMQGWGIDYRYEKYQIHEQGSAFNASGSIQTVDGRSIEFSLAFSMQSKMQSYESINFKAGDALIDPLVINFESQNIQFTSFKKGFDLNIDGKEDSFHFVGNGSGFLALDKNKDNVINNGSELFGPTLGNGFEELRAYDIDKNNWIDENDAVYDDLLIWTQDSDGNEALYSLQDKGIGTLFLGAVDTSFDIANKAKLKESSVFLKENGEAGLIQEIDLVV